MNDPGLTTATSGPSIVNVVARDMCVGCGACGVATENRIPVRLGMPGFYKADLSQASNGDLQLATRVCPFSNESSTEDQLGEALFPELCADSKIGRMGEIFAARIKDEDEIIRSSSGGMTTWFARQLLLDGDVDGVIHVGRSEGPLFRYEISMTPEDLTDRRKSAYYATTMLDVLSKIRGDGKRYALVAVPCYIRAARLLANEDTEFKTGLRFFLGIVCGHLKAAGYAESLAWQQGTPPTELDAVDFRVKKRGMPSKHYFFASRRRGSKEWDIAHDQSALIGKSWGHATFQLNACNFCDDIYAETADVAIGDAWLPRYEADWRGTNLLVVRDRRLAVKIAEGLKRGELEVDELDAESAVAAQAGNYRHRREGLAVRLADDLNDGLWVPRKRVSPSLRGVSKRRISLIRTRRELSRKSFDFFAAAKASGDLRDYLTPMEPLLKAYGQASRPSRKERAINKARRSYWRMRLVFASPKSNAPQTLP